MDTQRFVAVIGPSGSGKSTLVAAVLATSAGTPSRPSDVSTLWQRIPRCEFERNGPATLKGCLVPTPTGLILMDTPGASKLTHSVWSRLSIAEAVVITVRSPDPTPARRHITLAYGAMCPSVFLVLTSPDAGPAIPSLLGMWPADAQPLVVLPCDVGAGSGQEDVARLLAALCHRPPRRAIPSELLPLRLRPHRADTVPLNGFHAAVVHNQPLSVGDTVGCVGTLMTRTVSAIVSLPSLRGLTFAPPGALIGVAFSGTATPSSSSPSVEEYGASPSVSGASFDVLFGVLPAMGSGLVRLNVHSSKYEVTLLDGENFVFRNPRTAAVAAGDIALFGSGDSISIVRITSVVVAVTAANVILRHSRPFTSAPFSNQQKPFDFRSVGIPSRYRDDDLPLGGKEKAVAVLTDDIAFVAEVGKLSTGSWWVALAIAAIGGQWDIAAYCMQMVGSKDVSPAARVGRCAVLRSAAAPAALVTAVMEELPPRDWVHWYIGAVKASGDAARFAAITERILITDRAALITARDGPSFLAAHGAKAGALRFAITWGLLDIAVWVVDHPFVEDPVDLKTVLPLVMNAYGGARLLVRLVTLRAAADILPPLPRHKTSRSCRRLLTMWYNVPGSSGKGLGVALTRWTAAHCLTRKTSVPMCVVVAILEWV